MGSRGGRGSARKSRRRRLRMWMARETSAQRRRLEEKEK